MTLSQEATEAQLASVDQFCISMPCSGLPSYSCIPQTANCIIFPKMKKKVGICEALIEIWRHNVFSNPVLRHLEAEL